MPIEANTTAEVVSAETTEPIVEKPEVAETAEPGESKDKPDEKTIDSEKAIKKLQRSIDRLTAEKYKNRAEIEQLKSLRQQLSEEKQEAGDDQGDQRDVETRAQEIARELVAVREFNDKSNDVFNKGMKNPAFKEAMATFSDEVGGAFDESGRPTPIMLAVMDADNPHELIMHLADNPEVAAELAKTQPRLQIRRIAQIERDIAEAAKPKPSTAPKPAQIVKSAGASGEPDPKDTKAWIAYENEKLAARKGGRRY